MREYKRKGQVNQFQTDLPIKHIKKSLESSERKKAKREICKEVREDYDILHYKRSYKSIKI